MWKKYRDLYAGGERIRENAHEYLVRRHKEPGEIYAERLSRVFYENYVGSIVDWYAATLLRREPVLSCEGPDTGSKDFFNLLSEDCDLKGTNFSEFFRQRMIQAFVCGTSYIAVEFPRAKGPVVSRADEDASGRSRAYLVDYWPEEVINWNYDQTGSMEWVVIRTSCLQQSHVTDTKWEAETRWIYYDREHFQVYRKAGEGQPIELADEGRHGLASLRSFTNAARPLRNRFSSIRRQKLRGTNEWAVTSDQESCTGQPAGRQLNEQGVWMGIITQVTSRMRLSSWWRRMHCRCW
jgi:hypothetical protein